MKIKSFIRLFNRKNAWALLVLCVKHPLFVIPTVWATQRCLKLSTGHYGNLHHKNNPANAFRHALWNIILIRYCKPFSWSIKSSVHWAEKITTWHEEFSPNNPLAKAMDLHNNNIGRQLFMQHPKFTLDDFISLLKTEVQSAVFCKQIAEIEAVDSALVYIVKQAFPFDD